jgi:signal transduction histidine kinase
MTQPAFRVAVAVCSNFADEARAALAAPGAAEVSLVVFPARCGRPPLELREVTELAAAQGCEAAEVLGSACCSALRRSELPDGVRVHCMESCFELLAPRAMIEARLRDGAYLLTPGWLRRWPDRLAEQGLGDRAMAREILGEAVSKLLLLDTGIDADASSRLGELSEHLALPAEVEPVGVGVLHERLLRVGAEAAIALERRAHASAVAAARQRAAEYAAAFDLVGSLADTVEERDVIDRTLDVCTTLFAPARVAWLSVGGGDGLIVTPPLDDLEARRALAERLSRRLDPPGGFTVPIEHRDQVLGVLGVEEVSFPRFHGRYVELATTVARAAGMAVANARLLETTRHAVLVRDRFLSVASHELKTPLTSLLLQADTVSRRLARGQTPSAEETRRLTSSTQRQARRLCRLVDDMLDVSRFNARKLELRPEPLDFSSLVAAELEDRAEELRAGGYEVTARIEPGVAGVWDPQRIEQVVANLLGNAIRYGAGQPIDVVVSRDAAVARLEVRDRGPGIDPKHHDRIFRAFERATGVACGSGLGLGLFIVSQILAAHGGAISVRSALGEGATFIVELPLTR